jgi:hypothetical protein
MFSDWLGSETGPDKEASIASTTSLLFGVLTDMKPRIGAMKRKPATSRTKVVVH